jgi:hypothetical protein
MTLTQEQLKANEDFFNRVASMTKMYAWPDTGHIYKIEEGSFICNTPEAFNDLKSHTPKTFHHKIIMK